MDSDDDDVRMITTNLLVGNSISGIGFSKDRVVVMEMNELDLRFVIC